MLPDRMGCQDVAEYSSLVVLDLDRDDGANRIICQGRKPPGSFPHTIRIHTVVRKLAVPLNPPIVSRPQYQTVWR